MTSNLAIVLILSLLFNFCNGFNSSNSDVIEAIIGLNWTSGFQLMNPDNNESSHGFGAAMTKIASKNQIFVLPINAGSKSTGGQHYQILPVVFYSANTSSITDFIDVLANGYYASEGLLLLTEYMFSFEIKEVVKSCGYSRAFFHHKIGDSSDSIVRMQTFRHKNILVENIWKKEYGRSHYYPKYDFQGAKFTLLGTRNDYPYLYVIPNPFNPTLAYYSVGANIDGFDVLRAMYNFTLEVRIQLDNNWGIKPVSGELGDSNVTYSGIYGAIMKDEYDQASTAFQRNLEREDLFDFSIGYIYIRTHYLMDVEKAAKTYWTLYIRPLRRSAWTACFIMVFIFMTAYHLVEHLLARLNINTDNSLRIMVTVGWICYVIVEIHYEGALTMFFTTKNSLPFNTIEEGLKLYPEYKLIMSQGNENGILQAAQAGIKGMDEQLKRMETDPDLIKEDNRALLEALKEPGTFTLAYAPEVRAILKQRPVQGLTLQKIFPSVANNGFYCSLYPKRSPFKTAFDIGYRQIISSGQVDHFFNRRLPKEGDPPMSDPNEQLDVRQTGLAFVLLGCYIGLALFIFMAEITLGGNRRMHLASI